MQDNQKITPELVRELNGPTDRFYCPLSANHYRIQFLNFKIHDEDTGKTFFEIGREKASEEEMEQMDQMEMSEEEENEMRTVRYHFGNHFFDIKTIGTSLTFSVGSKPVKNFLMIERHYFRNQLIRSYEFNFPFCIPTTTNTWDSVYEVPAISEDLKQEMIQNPWETKSDSFYFVGGELIMHNKAEYDYSPAGEDEGDDNDEEEEEENF